MKSRIGLLSLNDILWKLMNLLVVVVLHRKFEVYVIVEFLRICCDRSGGGW